MIKKWYEKYKKLNPILFKYENSGKKSGLPPPYHARRTPENDYDTEDICGLYGLDKLYKILGYTEEPPFLANYPCVAIMFEDNHTFRYLWWHFMRS